MLKQYKIFQKISVYVLLTLILLQTAPACASSWVVDHNAYPVDTTKNGGENSFDNPSIKVEYHNKIFGTKSTILHSGDTTHLGTYAYFATLCRDKGYNGCNNWCAYTKGIECLNLSPAPICDVKDKNKAKCDIPLTHLIYNFCTPESPLPPVCTSNDPSNPNPGTISCKSGQVICDCGTPPNPNCQPVSPTCPDDSSQPVCVDNDQNTITCAKPAIGICAYHSKWPGWLKFLNPWLFLILNSIEHKDAEHAKDNYSSAACGTIDFKGFTKIDCFPVPPAPIPPPFGPGPFSPNEVYAYKVCTEEEVDKADNIPKHKLSSYMDLSENACVYRNDGFSTFYKQRVLISATEGQNTLKLAQTFPPDSKIEAVNKKNIYESAHVYDDGLNIMSANPQDLIGKPPSSQPPSGQPPQILELLFDAATGEATSTIARLKDDNNNSRTFKLAPKLEDDTTPPILATQVCLQECLDDRCIGKIGKWVNVKNGCVTRPQQPKPYIRFCDNAINVKAADPNPPPCFIITVDEGFKKVDYKFDSGVAQANCAYGFGNPPTPDPSNPSYNLLCQISPTTKIPFNWSAILTDHCYTNPVSMFSDGSDPACYNSVERLSTPQKLSCPKQDQPTSCSKNTYLTKLYFSNQTKLGDSVSGATKFCLLGYNPGPAFAWIGEISKNTVCASTIPETVTDPETQQPITYTFPREDIFSRLHPTSSLGLLSDDLSANCDDNDPSKDDGSFTQKTRIKNPVEAGLCVDVYPIKFKNSQDVAPPDNTILDDVLGFCYQKNDQDPYPNTYTTFDSCMYLFNYCWVNPLARLTEDVHLPPPQANTKNPNLTVPAGTLCFEINNLHTNAITTDCSKVAATLQPTCTRFQAFCNKPENTNNCKRARGECQRPDVPTSSVPGLGDIDCGLLNQIWKIRP